MLLEEEGREVKGYLSLYRESPDGAVGPTALTLAKESKEHAETLASMSGAGGEPWHKTGAGGFLRNVVYGFNDGLTANFGLVAGMIGAQGGLEMASHAVVVAGLAGMAADALSMGSSGYLAAKSEREVFEHEIAMEKEEIRLMPELEQEELSLLYQAKGIPTPQAEALAAQIMTDPARALEEQVREELKIGEATSTPMREAWITGTATALGAFIPVAPLLFDTGPVAIWTSFALAMLSHFARRRGAQLLHRPRRHPERDGHVPGGPRRRGHRLPAGRLDRQAAVIRWFSAAIGKPSRRASGRRCGRRASAPSHVAIASLARGFVPGQLRRQGEHRLHDGLRALLGDVVVRSVRHDEATMRRGADDGLVAVAPGAVDIRLLPPSSPGCNGHDGPRQAGVARRRITRQLVERAHHAGDGLVLGTGRVLDVRDRGLDEVARCLDEARVHGIDEDETADVLRIEVCVQERQQAAVRVPDDDSVGCRLEPLERLVELADLLPRREPSRAHAALPEAGTVVCHHRRARALGQRGLDTGPCRERRPTS